MKHIVRLTESKLQQIVKESIQKVLSEVGDSMDGQRALGALQARKVINADGDTVDNFFKNQAEKGGEVHDYAKRRRSKFGKDFDKYGNITNPFYKKFANGYFEYINSHPEELSDRQEKLRKLGYYG